MKSRPGIFPAIAALLGALMICGVPAANAGIIDISFSGLVDASGAKVDGVDAPVGSAFTLNISIDDSAAATGTYAVTALSFTTVVGSFVASDQWLTPLIATSIGASITLAQSPVGENHLFGESFLLSLTGFGPSAFDDPLTWSGDQITGDIFVKGTGAGSKHHLSGTGAYGGFLSISTPQEPLPLFFSAFDNVISEPGALAVLGLGLVILGIVLRRK